MTGCMSIDVNVEGQDKNSDNYTCAKDTCYQSYSCVLYSLFYRSFV